MMLQQGGPIDENTVGMVSVIVIFVVFPIVLAYARMLWKRGSTPAETPRMANDTVQRLVEMQRSLDAMALEMERISENQRFVTKLLSEKAPVALPKDAPSSRNARATD